MQVFENKLWSISIPQRLGLTVPLFPPICSLFACQTKVSTIRCLKEMPKSRHQSGQGFRITPTNPTRIQPTLSSPNETPEPPLHRRKLCHTPPPLKRPPPQGMGVVNHHACMGRGFKMVKWRICYLSPSVQIIMIRPRKRPRDKKEKKRREQDKARQGNPT